MANNRAGIGSGSSEITVTTETPPTTAAQKISTDGAAKSGEAVAPRDGTVIVHIEVIWGGMTHVKVPVTIAPCYQGLPLAGSTRAFDRQLDFWLTRARDLGMIGAALGQIFPVDLRRRREAGTINVDTLLLVGMGEPGHFAADDLRYLMSNVTVAVKSLGDQQLSVPLIGTRREELSVEDALRGFLEGILDGYQRFAVIAEAVTDRKEQFHDAVKQSLFVSLVEADKARATRIWETLQALVKDKVTNAVCSLDASTEIGREPLIRELWLEVARGDDIPPDKDPEPSPNDTDPDIPVTLLRVTRPAASVATPVTATPVGMTDGEIFQYSALSEVAAVTVREEELNSYLVRHLPDRMTTAASAEERETFGTFFANYLIPDDFRKFTEGPAGLTLVVDETTAAYPWEMAAQKRYSKTSFLGTSLPVSRQFRTLLAPAPSSPPALNRELRVLVIADPAAAAPGLPSLTHACDEALAVIDVLDHARRAWHEEYLFKVTVRVGSDQNPEVPQLDTMRERYGWIDVGRCNPLELAVLIVNEHFDVIHYAGHGRLDRKTGQAGWVFDRECFLSAREIFRVRQVPRLVFANACFSAVTNDPSEQRGHAVGLAQAFFARGIPNYIGAGWQVDDAAAQECARWFYTYILSLRSPDDDEVHIGRSPPAVIGYALRDARLKTFEFNKESSTWGAYQHYGRICDKLLPLPNVRSATAEKIR